MISQLQFSPATATVMHEHGLSDWIFPTWEKMFRFTNITLLVSGIAASIFLEIPLLAAGLATYGVFYFLYLLRGKVKNGSAVDDDAQSLQTDGVVAKGKYQKAVKKIEDQRKRINTLEATVKSHEGEIAALRKMLRR